MSNSTGHRTSPTSRSARHYSRQVHADGSPVGLVGLKNLKKANDALLEEVRQIRASLFTYRDLANRLRERLP
jgi:hypothetical protein